MNVGGDRGSEAGPQRSSRSFHGLQDFLPQAAGMASRGSQRFTAAVTGTAGREVSKYSASAPFGSIYKGPGFLAVAGSV